MKSFFAALMTALFLGVAGLAVADDITLKHDDFKQQTMVAINKRCSCGHNSILSLSAFVPDKGSSAPAVILLMIEFINSEWHYLDCHEINWLVGAKHPEFLSEYNSDLEGGICYEYLFIHLTPKELHNLVLATSTRFQVCNDEFVFNKDTFKMLSILDTYLHK